VNGAERININHLVPLPGSRIITGKLKFLRAKREFSVPGLLDTRQIRFIEKYKSVFISQWFVPGCRSNSRFRPSITKRLHEYCAVHYRAFNYLFSEAGISPSSLFACIRRGICFRGLSREVRRLAGPKRYLVFREIYKYERGLKRLVDRHPGRIPERGDTSPLDITAKYSLSDRVELLSTTAAVYGFMSVGKKEAGADRDGRFFLCLADTGPRIETYKVSRGCYSVFRALSGNSPKLLQNIPGMRSGEKREALVNALEKLNSIGGLIRG